jgi:hypothetical protein
MKHLCSQNSYPTTQCVGSLGPTAHKGWQVNMFTTKDVFLSVVSCLSEIRFYILYQKQIQLYVDVSSTSSKIKFSCQILIINSSTKQKTSWEADIVYLSYISLSSLIRWSVTFRRTKFELADTIFRPFP